MSNGSSPVPHMPTDIFTRLSTWQPFEGGIRETVNDPLYYLRVIGGDPGEVEWDLDPAMGWDTAYAKMHLSAEDAATIADCSLDEDGFTLVDSEEAEYMLHSNDGTPGAYLAEV